MAEKTTRWCPYLSLNRFSLTSWLPFYYHNYTTALTQTKHLQLHLHSVIQGFCRTQLVHLLSSESQFIELQLSTVWHGHHHKHRWNNSRLLSTHPLMVFRMMCTCSSENQRGQGREEGPPLGSCVATHKMVTVIPGLQRLSFLITILSFLSWSLYTQGPDALLGLQRTPFSGPPWPCRCWHIYQSHCGCPIPVTSPRISSMASTGLGLRTSACGI